MGTPLRRYLTRNDKTVVWFWRTYIQSYTDVSYSSLIGQLNGHSPLRGDVRSLIDNYIADVDREKEAKDEL